MVLAATTCLLFAAASQAGAAEILVWNDYLGGGIYKANADGSNVTEIPVPRRSASAFPNCAMDGFECMLLYASLSPDGTRIAFTAFNGDLYTSDLEGGNLRRIVVSRKASSTGACYSSVGGCPLERYWKAEWSPDSSSLVVERMGPYESTSWGTAIYMVGADGSNLRQLINWGGAQGDPKFSPDGQRLVFTSKRDPAGASHTRKSIYTTALDGSDPRRLTSQGDIDYELPSWGNSSDIVFSTFPTYEVTSDLLSVGPTGENQRNLTNTPDTYETNADHSSTGGRIAFFSYRRGANSTQVEVANRDGTNRRFVGTVDSFDGSNVSMGQGEYIGEGGDPAVRAAAALQQYAPILHYSMFETYRADAASAMTDNWVDKPGQRFYSNVLENGLVHGPARTLAAAQPDTAFPRLSLDHLGTYATSGTENHKIDAMNEYEADAARMHASGHGDRIYGRTVPGSEPDGGWVLQYWFFYYYNPKTYYGFGAHEGDWEMVQVELDDQFEPVRAAYSQHNLGETCSWDRVDKEGERPIVWVANGSHANYFRSGFHGQWGARDEADGFGEWVDSAQIVDITDPPAWLKWEGQWGGSESSPRGPMQQGRFKWSDPLAWSAGNEECTAG